MIKLLKSQHIRTYFVCSLFALASSCTFKSQFLESTSDETPSPTPTPVTISYISPTSYYTKDSPITLLIPALSGTPALVSISPALPTGLSLDPTTGVISGTPTTAIAPTTFTVTTTSSTGLTSTGTVQFEVAHFFSVNTTTDAADANIGDQICATAGGQCSLRAALEEGAALIGGLTLINLPGNLTYNANSTLMVNSRLKLTGVGSPAPQISGNNAISPVVQIANFPVSLENFTVKDGFYAGSTHVWGAGIKSVSQNLTLKDCTITANSLNTDSLIPNRGVGLYSSVASLTTGEILIDTCLISANTVTGGPTATSGGAEGVGAYLKANKVTIRNSTVSFNTLSGGNNFFSANGAGLYIQANEFTMTNSGVTDNYGAGNGAFDYGGGIFLTGTGVQALIEDFVCRGNAATYGGGCLFTQASYPLTIKRGSFSDNSDSSANGGGVTLRNATGAVTIEDSYFERGLSGTTALNVYASATFNLTVKNTTFYMPNRNAITIYASGLGNAYFENCTIINGISTGFYKVSSPSVVYFKNTIFGKTVGGAGNNCLINASEVVSQGYNIARDNSCGFLNPVLGDLSNTDALISVPASNGGPTMTSAISSTSPARDAVPLGSCSLTTDQRGNARPNGSACDIGAYEY